MKFYAELLVQEEKYLEEYPVRLFLPFHVQEGVGDSSSVALTINFPSSCEGEVASVAPSHCPVLRSLAGAVQWNNKHHVVSKLTAVWFYNHFFPQYCYHVGNEFQGRSCKCEHACEHQICLVFQLLNAHAT